MTTHDFKSESPENWDQKCCCVLVLDVSGSMEGTPIQELNEGLQSFSQDIEADSTTANRLEVSIVTFNSQVNTIVEPSLVTKFSMPTLEAEGGTKLVDGVKEGINIARSRKSWYKDTGQPYYRPWIILITDGDPDEMQNISNLSNEIRTAMANREFFFLAIGVQSADMKKLNDISDPSWPAMKLKGLKFSEFFRWLSMSMSTVTNSNTTDISLPNPAEWMVGVSI